MAMPVINHILPYQSNVGDPAEGPTAGRSVLDIWGRNFQTDYDVADTGPTGDTYSGLIVSDKQNTVSVTFNGVEAERVDVLSAIHLRVITPITPFDGTVSENYGDGSVDVVVTNLDENGDPIPGESVTVVDGFTYRHVKLDATHPSDLLRLVVTLIREVKRQVIPNVILSVNTDYDSDTSDGLNITDIATTPAIVLLGPNLPENRLYGLTEGPETEGDNGVVEVARKPRTVDLLFDVVGITEFTKGRLNLMSLFLGFMQRNSYIYMDRDPNDVTQGTVQYEFDFQTNGEIQVSKKASNSNLHTFTCSILIKGFDIEGFADFSHDAFGTIAKTLDDYPEISVNALTD